MSPISNKALQATRYRARLSGSVRHLERIVAMFYSLQEESPGGNRCPPGSNEVRAVHLRDEQAAYSRLYTS
jgi:hypothetical protein